MTFNARRTVFTIIAIFVATIGYAAYRLYGTRSMTNNVVGRVREFERALRAENVARVPHLLSEKSEHLLASELRERAVALRAVEIWAQPTLPWSIGNVTLNRESAKVNAVGANGQRISLHLVWEKGVWRIDLTKDLQAWHAILGTMEETIDEMKEKAPFLGDRPGAGAR